MNLKLIGGENPKLKTKTVLTNPGKAAKIGRAMVAFMMRHPGLGISANQFGVMERVCVAKLKGKWRIFIDPHITFRFGSQLSEQEGCLTWPGKRGDIVRPREVTIEHLTPDGDGGWFGREGIYKEFEAIVMEHEIDHLDGIRCIDKFIKKEVIE